MKVNFRLATLFITSVFIWLIVLGLNFIIIFEFLLPIIGIHEGNKYYDGIALCLILGNIIISSFLYSWYVGKPIVYIVHSLRLLANGNYHAYKRPKTKNGKITGIYALFSDIILHLEQLAHRLSEAKMERNRLDAMKKEWLAGISHDLKTPLTYITGYSTLLLSPDHKWTDDDRQRFLLEIQQKGQHMEELINDLNMSFSLTEQEIPLKRNKQNIIDFVKRNVLDIANEPSTKEYEFSFQTNEESFIYSFDEKLLSRALQNLLMNAVLHNPPCSIEVTIHIVHQNMKIEIQDHGQGMDEHTVKNLFQKYFRGTTTNTSNKGTGLGMTIAKKFITAHQGNILVTSELGKGTCIMIELPIKP